MSVATRSFALGMAAAELSVAREKILEHRLVSELAVLMLQRGSELDVLRSEFDANGYDVALEAGGIVRHLQLKATVEGGARSSVNINLRLATKPSGCILWMSYNPETLHISGLRWFGGAPGLPLPSLGRKPVKHTKANSLGEKTIRPGHRQLGKAAFTDLADVGQLADTLFGPARTLATSLVLGQLRSRWGAAWQEQVAAKLDGATFDESCGLAHLIDGYKVLEQLCVVSDAGWLDNVIANARAGTLPADVGVAWTALFMLHRAQRFTFASNEACDDWKNDFARHTVHLVQTDLLENAVDRPDRAPGIENGPEH